jgi:hypothetical protein
MFGKPRAIGSEDVLNAMILYAMIASDPAAAREVGRRITVPFAQPAGYPDLSPNYADVDRQ